MEEILKVMEGADIEEARPDGQSWMWVNCTNRIRYDGSTMPWRRRGMQR